MFQFSEFATARVTARGGHRRGGGAGKKGGREGSAGKPRCKNVAKKVFGRRCSRVFRKKNELQPLRMSKHVLRRLGRRERAKSFLRFWEFAFTKPKFLGFLRRVVPGFCVCPPRARHRARGPPTRRRSGEGEGRGPERGARGNHWVKTSQNTSFRTALL